MTYEHLRMPATGKLCHLTYEMVKVWLGLEAKTTWLGLEKNHHGLG